MPPGLANPLSLTITRAVACPSFTQPVLDGQAYIIFLRLEPLGGYPKEIRLGTLASSTRAVSLLSF